MKDYSLSKDKEDYGLKKIKINETKEFSFNKKSSNYINNFLIIFRIILFILLLFSLFLNLKFYNSKNIGNNVSKYINNTEKTKNYDLNFKYEQFENNVITSNIKINSKWLLNIREAYFINGIIRKHKPKNCLEIGVAGGGSSILILNAIKDIKNAFLISLDLNKLLHYNHKKTTGYRVKEYFPELTNKWKLYTGEQPHKFLVKFNMKFDFLFLDTAHVTPGELINFIEVLPFLKEKAIVVIHDILWQFGKKTSIKFYPSNLILLSSIYGDKIILKKENNCFENIGAVFLYSNQEKYFLDYFLLLYTLWEYIPTEKQIKELKAFIKKYYKQNIYVKYFDLAVKYNKRFIKHLETNKCLNKYRYIANVNKIVKIVK